MDPIVAATTAKKPIGDIRTITTSVATVTGVFFALRRVDVEQQMHYSRLCHALLLFLIHLP